MKPDFEPQPPRQSLTEFSFVCKSENVPKSSLRICKVHYYMTMCDNAMCVFVLSLLHVIGHFANPIQTFEDLEGPLNIIFQT